MSKPLKELKQTKEVETKYMVECGKRDRRRECCNTSGVRGEDNAHDTRDEIEDGAYARGERRGTEGYERAQQRGTGHHSSQVSGFEPVFQDCCQDGEGFVESCGNC